MVTDAGTRNNSELFNVVTQRWEVGPELPENFKLGCAVSLNAEDTKHLLLTGDSENAWIFDWLGSMTWEHAGYRSSDADSFVCTRAMVENGSRDVVVVAGGRTAICHNTVDIFDISSGTW